MLIYASCVSIENKGVLIAGISGSGKSDLALRLIDKGAELISDDQTILKSENNVLLASAPENIRGFLEVRHIGILQLPFTIEVPVTLYIDLAGKGEALERLPSPDTLNLLDHPVRRLRLAAFDASTPAKIRAALFYPTASDHL